jgi:hypothetical protein
MYFKLGDYRILERDIKYIRWELRGDGYWRATVCFRDGEELTVFDITKEEHDKIEEWWDKDIEKAMSYLYANTKEES